MKQKVVDWNLTLENTQFYIYSNDIITQVSSVPNYFVLSAVLQHSKNENLPICKWFWSSVTGLGDLFLSYSKSKILNLMFDCLHTYREQAAT